MKFSSDHEWIKTTDKITATVGITNYAQNQLGDIVFAELPTIGKIVQKGAEAAVVESVKAASDVYSPVSGEIIEVNTHLQSTPELINTDPENDGWFFKIRLTNPEELDTLMDEAVYKNYIGA